MNNRFFKWRRNYYAFYHSTDFITIFKLTELLLNSSPLPPRSFPLSFYLSYFHLFSNKIRMSIFFYFLKYNSIMSHERTINFSNGGGIITFYHSIDFITIFKSFIFSLSLYPSYFPSNKIRMSIFFYFLKYNSMMSPERIIDFFKWEKNYYTLPSYRFYNDFQTELLLNPPPPFLYLSIHCIFDINIRMSIFFYFLKYEIEQTIDFSIGGGGILAPYRFYNDFQTD